MVKKYQKEDVIKGVLDFIKETSHEGTLSEVASKLTNIAGIAGQAKTAYIYTVLRLSEVQKDQVREKLEKLVGHEISVRDEIDSKLLGGIRIKLGDWVYDSSVKGELEALKNELYGNI